MKQLRGRRYWLNLGRVLLLAGCAGALIVVAAVAGLSAQLAAQMSDPRPRLIGTPPGVLGADLQVVAFTTDDALTLRGWYLPASNGAAVILVHGYGGSRLDWLPEAQFLHAHGYGVLLFDLRGHGASDAAAITFGDHERLDVRAALDFVRAQPDVDPARIGAVGFSMGGAAVALAAAEDARIRVVVLEATFHRLDAVIAQQAGVFGPLSRIPARWTIKRSGVDVAAVRPVDALCAISPRPVFVIVGDADRTIPPGADSAMLAGVCDPAETWLIPGAGHANFTRAEPEEYPARLIAFLDRWLLE